MEAYRSPAVLIRLVSKCPDPSGVVSMSRIPNRAGSSRGGATGNSQKTNRPITLARTRSFRRGRYRSGRRHHIHAAKAKVTAKMALS
jgi:hypothetical protein